MNKKEKNLRVELSRELYSRFQSECVDSASTREIIEGTLFEKFLQTSDLSEKEIEKFAYSHFVTSYLLKGKCSEIESIEDVFSVSKIVEQGYYRVVRDFNAFKLKNNLSVSKEFGAFFTPIKIAREMAKAAVDGSSSRVIIDPCCGTGNLLAACIEYAKANDIELKKIVGIELDSFSAKIARKVLKSFSKAIGSDVEIKIINSDSIKLLSQRMSLFDEGVKRGTFIINPPYGKLKFESDKLTNRETKLSINKNHTKSKQLYIEERKHSISKYIYGLGIGKGTIEWSKVFLALCAEALPENESLVFIGPCGWLNSQSQAQLRVNLFSKKLVRSIHFISEDNSGFDTVNQPLAIVVFSRNRSYSISMARDFQVSKNLTQRDLLKLKSYSYAIPRVSSKSLSLFVKLQSIKKLSETRGVKNQRGELDQSLNKKVMVHRKTRLKIIRGENIGRFVTLDLPEEKTLYADEDEYAKQIGGKPKGRAYEAERVVGRQCSYMKQERRLVFDIVPKNHIVGNSCNYLVANSKFEMIFYLALLNSAVLDWYFRVLNGNNHVANYEIDDFPLPEVPGSLKKQIVAETKRIRSLKRKSLSKATTHFEGEYILESLAIKAFKLSREEAKIVLQHHPKLYANKIIGETYDEIEAFL